jgi:putative NIF3 family GTP cyclohydrolase 1 type 2
MKLDALYRDAVRIGIANDPRGKEEIDRLLREERERAEKMKPEEKEVYDDDRLFNPFADTRILFGEPGMVVRRALVGVDMEVPEILLAYLLNRDKSRKIDLVIAHHPEGQALARLHEVMRLQADILAASGVTISIAEHLLDKRIGEVERRLLPLNHDRAVSAARALGLPLICIHTPADNCVTHHLQKRIDKDKPHRLKDLLKLFFDIPEYKASARRQVAPRIVNGADSNRCGRVLVDMTGGTEGAKELLDKCAAAGTSTLVGMHFSEEYLEQAKKANINMVIAGHIASDALGLNLLLDEIERKEPLDIMGISGFERVRRGAKKG